MSGDDKYISTTINKTEVKFILLNLSELTKSPTLTRGSLIIIETNRIRKPDSLRYGVLFDRRAILCILLFK